MIFLKIYFGKTIIDDSVAGNVQGFKNFKIWPFLQILSFKLFLIAYTLSLCHIEAPHIVRNWPNFSWIQVGFLDMVLGNYDWPIKMKWSFKKAKHIQKLETSYFFV